MSRHTKYLAKMIKEFDSGVNEVISPDKLVKITRDKQGYIKVTHYDTLILVISKVDDLLYKCINGMSIELGMYAYSQTDARIINQVLDNYNIEYTAHTHKGDIYLE